jgi:hypothetical protein
VRCAAITRAGGRCKSVATEGTYCWNHAPSKVEARKQRASRGGKTGGNGRSSGLSETAEAKRWIKGLVAQLLKGEVERDVATACFMGLGTLARFIELERRIREQDEIEERLAALEELQPEGNTGGGYRAWHR